MSGTTKAVPVKECAQWQQLFPALQSQVEQTLGSVIAVEHLSKKRVNYSGEFIGRIVTRNDEFFLKTSCPVPRDPVNEQLESFELIQHQIMHEARLPSLFPRPATRGQGVAEQQGTKVIWVAHDWFPGKTANQLHGDGHNVADRVIDVLEAAAMPTSAGRESYKLPDATTKLRFRVWSEVQANPSALKLKPPEVANWILHHIDKLVAGEELLRNNLHPTHFVHLDPQMDNIMFPEEPDRGGVLIDGTYGRGPAWLTLWEFGELMRESGVLSTERLDQVVGRFGGTPQLLTAAYAAFQLADLIKDDDARYIPEGKLAYLEERFAQHPQQSGRTAGTSHVINKQRSQGRQRSG